MHSITQNDYKNSVKRIANSLMSLVTWRWILTLQQKQALWPQPTVRSAGRAPSVSDTFSWCPCTSRRLSCRLTLTTPPDLHPLFRSFYRYNPNEINKNVQSTFRRQSSSRSTGSPGDIPYAYKVLFHAHGG